MTILTLCTKYPRDTKAFLDELNFLREDCESYYDLPDYAQRKLAGLLIKSLDPIFAFEWLSEHRNSEDFMNLFARALIHDQQQEYEDAMDQLKDMATDYFAKALEELFLDNRI